MARALRAQRMNYDIDIWSRGWTAMSSILAAAIPPGGKAWALPMTRW
jgi:hypothetical protein